VSSGVRPADGTHKNQAARSRNAPPSPWHTPAPQKASPSPGSASRSPPAPSPSPARRRRDNASAAAPACRPAGSTTRNPGPPPASPDPSQPRPPARTATTAARPSHRTGASPPAGHTPPAHGNTCHRDEHHTVRVDQPTARTSRRSPPATRQRHRQPGQVPRRISICDHGPRR